jgi:hypothetical protein
VEEFQLLIVLHERQVTTFPLDCLDPNDPNAALKRGKRVSSHTSFFKTGICLGKVLIAVVKSTTLSSTIKVLEPIDQTMRGKKPQTSFMKRLNGGQDALKLFKVGRDPAPRIRRRGRADEAGVLHPHGVVVCAFPEDEALCGHHKGLRDRRPRDAGYAGVAGPVRRVFGLCPEAGQRAADCYLPHRGGLLAVL